MPRTHWPLLAVGFVGLAGLWAAQGRHLSAGGLAVTGPRVGVPTGPCAAAFIAGPLRPAVPSDCGTEHSFLSRVQVSAASALPFRGAAAVGLPLLSPRPSLLAAAASGPGPQPPRLPPTHASAPACVTQGFPTATLTLGPPLSPFGCHSMAA